MPSHCYKYVNHLYSAFFPLSLVVMVLSATLFLSISVNAKSSVDTVLSNSVLNYKGDHAPTFIYSRGHLLERAESGRNRNTRELHHFFQLQTLSEVQNVLSRQQYFKLNQSHSYNGKYENKLPAAHRLSNIISNDARSLKMPIRRKRHVINSPITELETSKENADRSPLLFKASVNDKSETKIDLFSSKNFNRGEQSEIEELDNTEVAVPQDNLNEKNNSQTFYNHSSNIPRNAQTSDKVIRLPYPVASSNQAKGVFAKAVATNDSGTTPDLMAPPPTVRFQLSPPASLNLLPPSTQAQTSKLLSALLPNKRNSTTSAVPDIRRATIPETSYIQEPARSSEKPSLSTNSSDQQSALGETSRVIAGIDNSGSKIGTSSTTTPAAGSSSISSSNEIVASTGLPTSGGNEATKCDNKLSPCRRLDDNTRQLGVGVVEETGRERSSSVDDKVKQRKVEVEEKGGKERSTKTSDNEQVVNGVQNRERQQKANPKNDASIVANHIGDIGVDSQSQNQQPSRKIGTTKKPMSGNGKSKSQLSSGNNPNNGKNSEVNRIGNNGTNNRNKISPHHKKFVLIGLSRVIVDENETWWRNRGVEGSTENFGRIIYPLSIKPKSKNNTKLEVISSVSKNNSNNHDVGGSDSANNDDETSISDVNSAKTLTDNPGNTKSKGENFPSGNKSKKEKKPNRKKNKIGRRKKPKNHGANKSEKFSELQVEINEEKNGIVTEESRQPKGKLFYD